MKHNKNRHIKSVLFWALQFFTLGLFAQAPSLINYQGSARLANGIPLGNKTIGIKFDIHEGSATGSVVASETQVLQTNLLGLFVTQIGKNTSIGNLNWQTNTMFLEVSIDTTGGSSYTSLGTQQMVSVPYAMNAAHVPSSYTGNVLTIGSSSFALTPTMAVTPNTSITVSGVGTVSSAGTNTFDINIPAPTFTGLGTATVTGAYPNYTVSSDVPTFTNTGQQIITGAYPNFTVNTPSVASVPDQTLTGTGLVNVTNPATNSFVIDVQSPTFSNPGQQIITGTYPNYTVNTPTVAAVPDQTLTGTGIVNVTNPATNSFVIDVQTPAFTGLGTASVSGSYPNYTVNSSIPTFTNTDQPIIVGSYPNFTVNTPTVAAVPDQTITGSGMVTVSHPATNSFVVGVPAPTLSIGSGSIAITGGNSVALPTTPSVSAAGIATVSSGPNYVVGVPAPTLSIGSGSIAITGGNSVALPTTPSVSAAGIATVSSGPNYVVGVPAPTLSIGSGSIAITGGNSVALPTTPSVSAAGIATVSSGPNYVVGVPAPTLSIGSGSIAITGGNSVALPTTPSVSAAGIATVSSGPNYVVGVPAPTLSIGSGSIAITGGNSVALPTTPSVSAAGIATVSSGPNYMVGVQTPTFTNTGQNIITGSYPNFSVNTPTVAGTSIAVTATAAAGPSVSTIGTNSFNINIPQNQWKLAGNAGTTPGTDFIGTTDAQDLQFKTNNTMAMTIFTSGNIGVGGAGATGSKFDVAASTSTAGFQGLNSTINFNSSSNSGGLVSGGRFVNNSTGTGGAQLNTGVTGYLDLTGGANTSQFNTGGWLHTIANSGTHNNAIGALGSLEVYSGANLTNAYGGYFSHMINAGTITNGYGVYVGNVYGTNKWSLYNSDASAPSYFAGNVGIGSATSPAFKLDIVGTGGPRLRVFSQDGFFAGMLAKNNTHEYFVGIQGDYESAGGTVSGFHIYDNTANARRFLIDANGLVGINTSAPTATLHVTGTTRLVDGTEGAGKVLTSDALGNASWQAPAGGWALTGNAGTTPATNYIGTSDAQPLVFRTNGVEKMRVLTNGNIGIGTSAPSTTFAIGNGTTEKFNISGTEGDMTFLDDQASITFTTPTASSKPMIQIFPSGTTNLDRMVISHSATYPNYGLQYQDVGDKMNFLSNGNPVLTVDLTYQNVGVGTSSPGINTGANRYLSISSTTNYITSTSALELEGGSTSTITPLSRIDFNSATGTVPSANVARIASYRTGSNTWGALGFHTSNGALQERMRIDENGHVGIGTTQPDYKLSIYGTTGSATDGPNMSFVTSQDAYPTMHVLNWNHNEQHFLYNSYYDGVFKSSSTAGNFDLVQYGGKFIIKAAGGYAAGTNINTVWTDALMVRNNGFVGIGIPYTSQPSYLFHVQKDDPGTLAYFDNNSIAGGTCLLAQVTTAASSTGNRFGIQSNAWYGMSTNYGLYSYAYGGTNSYGVFGIAAGATGVNYGLYCSGNGAYTGSWANVSDRKFKENILPYTGALKQIMALEPKTYTYKNEEYSYMGFPKGNQIGLIAQEVETVIPELVESAVNPGPLDPETRKPVGKDVEYKSMNYIGLTPVLVQAVKEQQAQIEDLKKQLEEQKQLINALLKK